MADRPPLRVPEATAQHAVGTRRTTSRSAPSLTDAFCETCTVVCGPLRADEAAAWVWGHLAGGVPPFLPSELSTVDDVGRVCEAAGLTYDDHDGEWKADGVRVSRSFGLGRTMTVFAHYPMQGRRPIVDLFYGAETTVLWSAIQAARGGEHRD